MITTIANERCEEKRYPFTLRKQTTGRVTRASGANNCMKKSDKMTICFVLAKQQPSKKQTNNNSNSKKKHLSYQFSPASKGWKTFLDASL